MVKKEAKENKTAKTAAAEMFVKQIARANQYKNSRNIPQTGAYRESDAISEESSMVGSSEVSKFSFTLDASEIKDIERNDILKAAEARLIDESNSSGSDASIHFKKNLR